MQRKEGFWFTLSGLTVNIHRSDSALPWTVLNINSINRMQLLLCPVLAVAVSVAYCAVLLCVRVCVCARVCVWMREGNPCDIDTCLFSLTISQHPAQIGGFSSFSVVLTLCPLLPAAPWVMGHAHSKRRDMVISLIFHLSLSPSPFLARCLIGRASCRERV